MLYILFHTPTLSLFIHPFIGSRAERHESNCQSWILGSTISYPHDTSVSSSLFLPFFLFISLIHSFFICFPRQCLLEAASGTSTLWQPPFPEGQIPQRSGALGLFSHHVSVAKAGATEPGGSVGTAVSLVWDIPRQGSSSPCNLCERLLCSGHFNGNHMEPPFLMGEINLDGAGLAESSWQGSGVVCPLQPQCRSPSSLLPILSDNL